VPNVGDGAIDEAAELHDTAFVAIFVVVSRFIKTQEEKWTRWNLQKRLAHL